MSDFFGLMRLNNAIISLSESKSIILHCRFQCMKFDGNTNFCWEILLKISFKQSGIIPGLDYVPFISMSFLKMFDHMPLHRLRYKKYLTIISLKTMFNDLALIICKLINLWTLHQTHHLKLWHIDTKLKLILIFSCNHCTDILLKKTFSSPMKSGFIHMCE